MRKLRNRLYNLLTLMFFIPRIFRKELCGCHVMRLMLVLQWCFVENLGHCEYASTLNSNFGNKKILEKIIRRFILKSSQISHSVSMDGFVYFFFIIFLFYFWFPIMQLLNSSILTAFVEISNIYFFICFIKLSSLDVDLHDIKINTKQSFLSNTAWFKTR